MNFDPYKIIRGWLGRPDMPIEETAGFYNKLAQVYGEVSMEEPQYDLALSRFHLTLRRFEYWLTVEHRSVSPLNLPSVFRDFLEDGNCPDGTPKKIIHDRVVNRFDELIDFLDNNRSPDTWLLAQIYKVRDLLEHNLFTFEEEEALDKVSAMMQSNDIYRRGIGENLLACISMNKAYQPVVPAGYVDFVKDLSSYFSDIAAVLNNTPMKTHYFRVILSDMLNTLKDPQNHRDSMLWQLEFTEKMRKKMNEDIGGSVPDIAPYLFLLVYEGAARLAIKLYSVLGKVIGLRPRLNVISLIFLCTYEDMYGARRSLVDAALNIALAEGERIDREFLAMDSVDLTMALRRDPEIRVYLDARARNDIYDPRHNAAPGIIRGAYEKINYEFRDSSDKYFPHHLLEGIVALMRYSSDHGAVEEDLVQLVNEYLVTRSSDEKNSRIILDTTVPLLNELLALYSRMQEEGLSLDERLDIIAESDAARDFEGAIKALFEKKSGTRSGGAPNNPPVGSGGSNSSGGSNPTVSAPVNSAINSYAVSGLTYISGLPPAISLAEANIGISAGAVFCPLINPLI
jgi:hypothetical protein